MQQAGFSDQADSWVSRGANQPISPDAMTQIFGRDGIEQISRQAGVSQEEAARGLSQLLPEVVDHMTPDGDVPDDNALANSVISSCDASAWGRRRPESPIWVKRTPPCRASANIRSRTSPPLDAKPV
jgi:hypothetical protein